MQDLTPVGLSEDRTTLILVNETGEEFAVAADARLRAALRGDDTRPGQLETKMDSVLRPRDIQARIRSGESPESVAAAAQTTVDKIMGFAAPVMAERAYIAQQAQKASVRRRAGDGPVGHLGDAAAERLQSRNVSPESVEWDAWRREDGRWTVAASYRSGQATHHAEFVYDVAGRYVIAEDDESRWLVGERVAGQEPQDRGQSRAGGAQRRLAPVQDEQLPLGDDAIEVVTGRRPVDEPLTFEPSVPSAPSTERSAARSARRETEPDGDESMTADLTDAARAVTAQARGAASADWMETQASDRPAEPVAPPTTESSAPEPEEEPVAAEQEEPAPAPAARRSGKSRGRASVPSWDEIMFGSGRQD